MPQLSPRPSITESIWRLIAIQYGRQRRAGGEAPPPPAKAIGTKLKPELKPAFGTSLETPTGWRGGRGGAEKVSGRMNSTASASQTFPASLKFPATLRFPHAYLRLDSRRSHKHMEHALAFLVSRLANFPTWVSGRLPFHFTCK